MLTLTLILFMHSYHSLGGNNANLYTFVIGGIRYGILFTNVRSYNVAYPILYKMMHRYNY